MAKKANTSAPALKPLDDRIVVQPDKAEEKTKSGIYLPEAAKEKPQTGTVVAAGPGKTNDDGQRVSLAVSVGDTVLYGKYAGTEVELDGETYMIMRESELLGVMG